MSLFVIRSCKRYAVRHPVSLDQPDDASMDGLLIEVSLEGCRISNLGTGHSDSFATGEATAVEIEGFGKLPGTVRWAHDKVLGLRFDPPLHADVLGNLIALCRGEPDAMRSYGT